MNPIRVLVANRPRLIRELVMATISDQPDIEIVGEIQQEADLEHAVEETRPDFLIVALERSNSLSGYLQEHLAKSSANASDCDRGGPQQLDVLLDVALH